MNVPASTSALPSNNSFGASRSGKIAYLSGLKNAASTPITQENGEERGRAAGEDRGESSEYDGDLAELDQPDQPSRVVLVGKLSGGRREQKEGQDEERAGERDQDLR